MMYIRVNTKNNKINKMHLGNRRGSLWRFYQVFELSFWRHPFTAEDPLMSMWILICSDEEKLMRVSKFSFLGELAYSFNTVTKLKLRKLNMYI